MQILNEQIKNIRSFFNNELTIKAKNDAQEMRKKESTEIYFVCSTHLLNLI